MKDDDYKSVPCPFCKGVKSAKCTHCKGRGTFEIAFASTESIEYLSTFTDMVMEAIEKVTGIRGAWISDESMVADFPIEEVELAQLNDLLGVKVDIDDTIVEVAKRLRDA
jgi:5,10-methylene-tetrahydrofolate dehydrogenase/methenyl tetrahydrofolate cyclohydrolase